jgi:hypothetical protein
MRRPLYGIARPEPERTPTGLGERCVSQNPAVATEMMKENTMATKNGPPISLDRMNAVLAWWGLSGTDGAGKLDGQFKRFQVFTSDLQKAYGETYGAQMSAFLGANARIGRSLLELIQCRQPQDVIAAESSVMAAILDEAWLQMKTWLELSQRVQEYCVTMARETADEIRQQAIKAADPERSGKAL